MTLCLTPAEDQADPAAQAAEAAMQTAFGRLVARQRALSSEELTAQHVRWLGPKGLLSNFSRQVEVLGRGAPLLDDLSSIKACEHRCRAEQAVRFVLGYHRRRTVALNPFRDLSREQLCCVIYDYHLNYVVVERYAALQALRQLDGEFFKKLIATTRRTVERRVMFRGLLEHFDALLPIEQSVYPIGYRQVQVRHLEHEEAIYGTLQLSRPVTELLASRSPRWLLKQLAAASTPRPVGKQALYPQAPGR